MASKVATGLDAGAGSDATFTRENRTKARWLVIAVGDEHAEGADAARRTEDVTGMFNTPFGLVGFVSADRVLASSRTIFSSAQTFGSGCETHVSGTLSRLASWRRSSSLPTPQDTDHFLCECAGR